MKKNSENGKNFQNLLQNKKKCGIIKCIVNIDM